MCLLKIRHFGFWCSNHSLIAKFAAINYSMKDIKTSLLRQHKINPFLERIDFRQDTILKEQDPYEMPDPNENVYYFYKGKYAKISSIKTEELIENWDKCTLYKEGNFYDPSPTLIYDREIILQMLIDGKLSDKACRILLYVITKLGKNSSAVKLNQKLLVSDLKIIGRDYNKYLGELVSAGFIAKKDDSEYWINPNFFFHGRRFKQYMNTPLYHDFGLENYDRNSDLIKPEEVTLGREIITRGSAYRLSYDEEKKIKVPKYLCELQHQVERPFREDKFEYHGVVNGINLDIKEKVDNIKSKYSKAANKKKPRKKKLSSNDEIQKL